MTENDSVAGMVDLSRRYAALHKKLNEEIDSHLEGALMAKRVSRLGSRVSDEGLDYDTASARIRPMAVEYKRIIAQLHEAGYTDVPDIFSMLELSDSGKLVCPSDAARVANVDKDFITLEGVVCVDAKGDVIEKYNKLQVKRDVERKSNGTHASFTPYNATRHFESQGLFLPSFALSCNILAALYANRDDAEVQKVLMQYKDHGADWGWHAQNTLVNWGTKQIIHYPGKADYVSAGGTTDINQYNIRKPLTFNNIGFKHRLLEDALRNKEYMEFLQNLSGLQNPEVLVEIGAYFGKPAKSWISTKNKTRAAWLGCSIDNFFLYTVSNLDSNNAARGVRAVPALSVVASDFPYRTGSSGGGRS